MTPSPLLRSLCPLPVPLLVLAREQEKTRKEMKENISQLLLASEYMALVLFFLTGFGMASVFVCKFYEKCRKKKSIY